MEKSIDELINEIEAVGKKKNPKKKKQKKEKTEE